MSNLPGVEHDEKELTKVLKNYPKQIKRDSENVLEDLENILQEYKQKPLERIHFHYSGIRRIHHIICMYINVFDKSESKVPIKFQANKHTMSTQVQSKLGTENLKGCAAKNMVLDGTFNILERQVQSKSCS